MANIDEIKKIIDSDIIIEVSQKYLTQFPTANAEGVAIKDAREKLLFGLELLKLGYNNGTIKYCIPSTINTILANLNSLKNLPLNNMLQYGNNYVAYILSLLNNIYTSPLLLGVTNFNGTITDLSELVKVKGKIKPTENDIKRINEIKVEGEATQKDIIELNEKIKEIKSESEQLLENIKTTSEKVELSKVSIEKTEKDVEIKKLSINTFSENVDEYKEDIIFYTNKAKEILAKETKINELINQAENALNLKSAEGISAAFNSQYIESKNKDKYKWWIWGALFFILTAVGLVTWSLLYSINKNIDTWNLYQTISRVVIVGLCISGSTYCANQYNKQKRLIEDYAYKAVLSKSIVAFTKQIKEVDPQKVAEYLTSVLSEIHKDPLRKDENPEKEDTSNPLFKVVESLISKIPDIKK